MSGNRADYGAIVKLAVQQNGEALYHVPMDSADYGELAKLAVQLRGGALHLQFVPTDRADYGGLAKLAVTLGAGIGAHGPRRLWRAR